MTRDDALKFFDPSSVDDAMRLAYAAIELARIAMVQADINPRANQELRLQAFSVARRLKLHCHGEPMEHDPEVMTRVLEELE